MNDKIFKRQLEKFGIESTRVVDVDIAQKRKSETTEMILRVVKTLMETTEGRQWIYSKLNFCCVFSTPYVAGKPDATAFLCGLQEFGHHLQNEVMLASPNEYFLMVQEAATRELNSLPQKD